MRQKIKQFFHLGGKEIKDQGGGGGKEIKGRSTLYTPANRWSVASLISVEIQKSRF